MKPQSPISLPRKNLFAILLGAVLFLTGLNSSLAATSINTNPPAYYRLSQLDDAVARAKKEDKPIAWIAAFPGHLKPCKNPLAKGSNAATYYAYLRLYRDAIIVWSDSDSENHQEPAIVDRELHSPDAHYAAPGVIVLTPDLQGVIGKAFYIADPKAREATFNSLAQKAKDKKTWPGSQKDSKK